MNNSLYRKACIISSILLIASLLLAPFLAAAPAANNTVYEKSTDTNHSEALRLFASQVIEQLSQQEPFTSWKDADYTVEPLGPGTRSWLVTITDPQHPAQHNTSSGYLIVSVTADGQYKLVEYGMGPDSIYAAAMRQAIQKAVGRSITPLYAGPGWAEWNIVAKGVEDDQFWDALTGELLPQSKAHWAAQLQRYAPPRSAIGSEHFHSNINFDPGYDHQAITVQAPIQTGDSFEPYDNIMWMTAQPLANVNSHSLQQLLAKHKQLVYYTTGEERTYFTPFPIFGYQLWSSPSALSAENSNGDALYVWTGTSSSSRFISLDTLIDSGSFVTPSSQ